MEPGPESADATAGGRSTRGRLLVATPDLRDPNFARTVVLMLEHSDEGALGVVLNRPTDVPVRDVLPEWGLVCAPPACLFVGGPVQPDAAIALGRGPDGFGPVDLDGDADAYSDIRVFLGYAGWAAGQLEMELAAGGWLVLDRAADDVATSDPSELWRTVLRRQPGRVAMFALAPEDPSLN